MRGYGFLFVAVCMTLIAASVGAVLHFAVGLSPIEASLVALVVLFALTILEVSAARRRDRSDFADRFEGLARTSADIAREVGELRHRIAAFEAASAANTKAATEPLAREIGALAQLVEEVAQSVANHDAVLAARGEIGFAPAPAAATSPAQPAAARPAPDAGRPFGTKSEREIAAIVREAVETGRVELYLQPVVTLPQRKVRYYEALSRLRLADGTVVEAGRFLPAARAAGLLPRIDERVVHNCVQVVRRLAARNREVGLFLNVAPETLSDRAVFSEILGYLDANRALAPSLVLELPQSVYRSLGVAELNGLALLAERGFRFSLDRIEDLRIDPHGLAERGVRFIKVPAALMLDPRLSAGGHVHPADLADLLGRYGIDLVADRIETETVVLDLLDYDVRYGQGFLFAPPRPVRAEVLGGGERVEPASAVPAASPVAAKAGDPAASTAFGTGDIARTVRRA